MTSGTVPGLGRPDLRLAAPAVAAWSAALAALWTVPWLSYLGAAGALLLAVGCLLASRVRPGAAARVGAVIAVCAAAGAASAGARVAAVRTGPLSEPAARHATVTVRADVTDEPRPLNTCTGPACRGRTLVRARATSMRTAHRSLTVRVPILVLAGRDARNLHREQGFTVRGELAPPHPGELLAAVLYTHGRISGRVRPPPPYAVTATIRDRLRTAVAELPQPERGLLPALVVGDTARIPGPVTEQFTAAGLTHLLAVSGANLMILVGAVAGILRLLRCGPVGTALSALPCVVVFVLVAGFEPSVLRAAVMGVIVAVAVAAGRERSGTAALSAAVLGLVLFDPGLARSYGFALSVLATAGIILLAPRIGDRLARRMPRWLAVALAVPTAAEVVCAPVVAMMSSRVSLVAVPANLIAGPLVAPATVFGALATALAPVALPVARVLVWPAGCAVAGIAAVARTAARLPDATIPWPGGFTGALLLVAVLITVVVLARRRRILVCAAACTLLVVSVTFRIAAPGWPAGHWLMTACDVGQGDALALSTGPHAAVLVDTGPRPDLIDACLHRLSVTRVPLVILSHFHADHAGGLSGVLRGRSVGAVAASPYHVPAEEYAQVKRELAARRIPLWTPRPGWRWRIGRLRLTVLAPSGGTADLAAAEGDDAGPNDASLVVSARSGPLTLLLTGDVEPPAQRALLDSGTVPRVRVVKVPHHGSGNQDADFLAATGARAAVISVGADNGYGHPAPRTLARLRGLGITVYRTDTDGDIAVSGDGAGGLTVTTRGESR